MEKIIKFVYMTEFNLQKLGSAEVDILKRINPANLVFL